MDLFREHYWDYLASHPNRYTLTLKLEVLAIVIVGGGGGCKEFPPFFKGGHNKFYPVLSGGGGAKIYDQSLGVLLVIIG